MIPTRTKRPLPGFSRAHRNSRALQSTGAPYTGGVPSGWIFEDASGFDWYYWFDLNGILRVADATTAEAASFNWATGGLAVNPMVDRISVTKSATYSVLIADSGYLFNIDTDAFTLTLPATVIGMRYTFRNVGADGAVLVTLAPNASDKIQGVGISALDNKALLNTKATAKYGDFVTLVADGVDGWFVHEMRGIWARAA